MSEPIYDGFTWPVRKCTICGKVEEMPGSLCFLHREEKRAKEYMRPVVHENGRIT